MALRRLFRRKFNVTVVICIFCFVVFVTIFPLQNRKQAKRHSSDSKHENIPRQDLELLKDKDERFVVYNRVPKCGSMSMTTVCYRAGGVNGFKVASPYENGEKQAKTEEEQEEFIDFLHQQPPGYLYIRHQYFIDFTRFNSKQPIYINMIRDPVARFESFYYFSRFGNERGGGAGRMSDVRRQEGIDECIQNNRQECSKPYWQMVPYFCGQDPGCMSRSQWAVDKAKENIKKHYVFVGILEDLDTSLRLLEAILPKYFKNALNIYHNPENERLKFETHTKNKKKTSEAAKEFLKTQTSIKLEYDLYVFVQNELNYLRAIYL
ncbi:unnamed protein product [Clavelina lepadiformis]|uniref:Uncharacterized protein n=1 Tax=Clavelina lepadiformis TaxID=159417 RepID=A0ABP0GRY8_CLALP